MIEEGCFFPSQYKNAEKLYMPCLPLKQVYVVNCLHTERLTAFYNLN